MTDPRASNDAHRRLWDEALKQLTAEDAAVFSNVPKSDRSTVNALITTINDTIEQADRESWKYTKSNGDVVVLRTVLEKALKWVQKFEAVVDAAVSYDVSGHAAAPWAIVKLLLNTGLNSLKTRGEVVEGVEYTARIVTLYGEIEQRLLRGTSRLRVEFMARIKELYVSVLTFFAKALKYLRTGSTKRFFQGVVHYSDSIIGEWLGEVKDTEEEVLKVKSMVDSDEQRALLQGCKTTLDSFIADNKLKQGPSDTDRRAELEAWLNAIIPSDTLSNARMARSADTCNWILEREFFKQWKKGSPSTRPGAKLLWIHAGPGFGKTVLSARLIDHMQTETPALTAYFFVVSDDKLRRDSSAILRSWIYQVAIADSHAFDKVYESYKNKSKKAPDISELWDIFGDMVKKKRYCFIIDGYDECATASQDSKYQTVDARAQFLHRLISRCAGVDILLLVVSRDQADIRSALETARTVPGIEFDNYGITTADTKSDIQALARAVTSEALANKAHPLQEEIASEAAERADGLFLWISLLRKKLEEERGQNAKQLRAAVGDMPDGLESAYEQEFARLVELGGIHTQRAMAVLRWVLFAARPMTVKELAEALILNSEAAIDRYPSDELPDEWATKFVDEEYVNSSIRLSCGSLIELRSPTPDIPVALQTVHFVHYSVKEFLLRPVSNRDAQHCIDTVRFPDAATEHDRLATLCLQYLCYDIFDAKTKRLGKINKRLRQHPFLRYAAISWPYHALAFNEMSQHVRQSAERLFSSDTENWRLWSEVFESRQRVEDSSEFVDQESALKSSTEELDDDGLSDDGFTGSGSDWDDSSSPVNEIHPFSGESDSISTRSKSRNTAGPIYYAAWLGLTDMVKTLQAKGFACDTCGGLYHTPLQAAVANGFEDTVEYLISQDVDISREGGEFGSAITAAVVTGSIKMVQMLLAAGADLRKMDPNGRTLLHIACYNGDNVMVEALLKHEEAKALLDTVSTAFGETPLHEAVQAESSMTVKILLQHKVDVNVVSKSNETPLTLALTHGQEDIVRMLVHAHADITFCTETKTSILHMAAGHGMLKMVKYLVEHEADISARNECGLTALHFAVTAPKSSKQIMTMLLDQGAAVDVIAEDGATPLIYAAAQKEAEAAALLIEKGARIDSENASAMTPLSCAVGSGGDRIVRLLLEHGAEPTLLNCEGDSALDLALAIGEEAQVEMLLSYGALTDTSTTNLSDYEVSPEVRSLQTSLFRGEMEVFSAAIARIDDLEDPNKNSLLLAATMFGASDVALQLLAKGASSRSRGKDRRTPLHLAARGGHADIVEELLSRDLSLIHAQDGAGRKPLDRAVRCGRPALDVINILLQHGAFDFEEHLDLSKGSEPSHTDHQDTDPVRDPLALKEVLTGKWCGEYTYQSWLQGRVDPTAITFVLDSQGKDYVNFHSDSEDTGGGPFFARGSLRGTGAIRWVKLYDDHGWIYVGTIHRDGVTMTGSWGSSINKAHGTFTMNRLTEQTHNSAANETSQG